MLTLHGKTCSLRALEPEDLDFLFSVENNMETWELSGTLAPYSRAVLKDYLENSHRDIYEVKQLRLCICDTGNTQIGLIDLFDFDPKNSRVGMGIIVLDPKNRNKGFGAEAITLLMNYVFSALDIHQVYANILEDNRPSRHLFEKMGFKLVGIKKDWIKWEGVFKNELLYQKIKS